MLPADLRMRTFTRSALLIRWLLTITMLSPGLAMAQPELPFCWQEMEIEAKWKISNKKFNEMRATFSQRAGLFDRYRLDVRWEGNTNQFIDNFYDTGSKTLSKALNTLRHRTRYGTTDGENWQEVQYKSTPCFIDAAWFRLERGDCRVSDELGRNLCDTEGLSYRDILSGQAPEHPAMAALLQDHADIDLSTLAQFLQVSTHRYRARFLDENDQPVFRVTLDKVTRTENGMHALSFEAEIEMINDHATEASVFELLRLAKKIEEKFSLGKSRIQVSKTGAPISSCPLPSPSLSTIAACTP